MTQLSDRIAQFRKMANDDPDNELAHYRLGQLLAEDGQHPDACQSFRRALELSPHFSKVYQLLAQSLLQAGARQEAIDVLRQGFDVADERGDNMPRDEMARMLVELGEPAPVSKRQTAPAQADEPASPARASAASGRPAWLARAHGSCPPRRSRTNSASASSRRCADCWADWVKNYSVKVINELRLNLSTERGQAEYDRYMREFLGIE